MTTQNTIQLRADPLGRGRRFDAHEVGLMLLSLLAGQPQHGYELIKRLASLSNGFYSPSPGVLYPALARLEAEGHATVEVQGNRKCYHLSSQGQAYLQANQRQADHLFAVLRHAARKIAWMRQAEVDEALATSETGWLPEFVAIRRELKSTLFQYSDASHDEQRRVVTILRRALDEIRDTRPAKENTL